MEPHLAEAIRSYFNIPKTDVRTFSPLALAYIGDDIFDLVVRTLVVEQGNVPVQKMHGHTSHVVRAASQAAMIECIQDVLTDEEAAICRRGRNAKSHTTPKNASVADYRKATGLEALLGYLYLEDRTERLFELIGLGLQRVYGGSLDELDAWYGDGQERTIVSSPTHGDERGEAATGEDNHA